MFKMLEGTSIKSHLDELNSILLDLEIIGKKVREEDQAVFLLCSLPLSYKHFQETILYGREIISFENVKYYLFSKELIDKDMTIILEGQQS